MRILEKPGQPQILIDPDEAQRIEKNIILRGIYYRPTGYHPNPKSLRDACKKEGHRFRLSECKNFLEDQESYQLIKPLRNTFLESVMGE